MKKIPKASIVIPVYNEEDSISQLIENIHQILNKFYDKNEIEILIVDDGSEDDSSQVISEIKNIRFFRHPKNQGYGSALKTGIKHAKSDIILIIDADKTYPVEYIPELLNKIDDYDMVVGSRSLKSENIPFIRKPAKYLIGKLANYLAETNIPDLNSGFRVFKKDIALKYYKILPSGFSFTTTITLAMLCNGYNVDYISIPYERRLGKSKFRPIKDTMNLINLLWRTTMYFNPLKIFLPFVFISFILSFISFLYDVVIHNDLTDKTIILFLAFVQITIITLIADLIDKRN